MSDEIVDQENDDDEMEEKLKGDSIGDTLYSEKWVLKTLMKLTQDLPKYSEREDSLVELDETLESDLCLLWDMTSDPDVATCLFKHDIVDLVKCIILHSQAPRLTVRTIFQISMKFRNFDKIWSFCFNVTIKTFV